MGDEAEYLDDGADYIDSVPQGRGRKVYCHDIEEYVPVYVCKACGDCEEDDDD